MTENPGADPRHPDEELATFTDLLLAGEAEDVEMGQGSDALHDTVVQLWRSFGVAQPGERMSERIYENLVAEWRETMAAPQPVPFWRRLHLRRGDSRRAMPAGRMVYAMAAAAVVVVLGLALATAPTVSEPLPGAAGSGEVNIIPFILALGIVLGAVAWWLGRRKR